MIYSTREPGIDVPKSNTKLPRKYIMATVFGSSMYPLALQSTPTGNVHDNRQVNRRFSYTQLAVLQSNYRRKCTQFLLGRRHRGRCRRTSSEDTSRVVPSAKSKEERDQDLQGCESREKTYIASASFCRGFSMRCFDLPSRNKL